MITLEEDREFLSAQRLEGRQGSMISKNLSLSKQESRRQNWDEEKQHCVLKTLQEQEKLDETVQLSSVLVHHALKMNFLMKMLLLNADDC